MSVHNHGIDPSCRERLVGECLLKTGAVVLDLGDPAYAVKALRGEVPLEDITYDSVDVLLLIADQIETQTKPPRTPEPGLWGVVAAHVVGTAGPQAEYHWVGTPNGWEAIGSQQRPRDWDDLVDPVLIREGIDR